MSFSYFLCLMFNVFAHAKVRAGFIFNNTAGLVAIEVWFQCRYGGV